MVACMATFPPIGTAAHQDRVEEHVGNIITLAVEEDGTVSQIVLNQTTLSPAAAHNGGYHVRRKKCRQVWSKFQAKQELEKAANQRQRSCFGSN